MKVICKGYKTCDSKEWCSHAKIHELERIKSNYCFDEKESIECNAKECCCDDKLVRKVKLENLEKYESR